MSATFEAPLRGSALTLATLVISLGCFMNVLDTTIAVVALPTIAGELAATPSQASWVITSYAICLAVVLPLSGWIARRFGQVRVFCVSVLLFAFASWLCAAAWDFNQLLLFRALQGLAGGLLLPLSQTLLLRIYPPEEHGFALGIWGITGAVAPVVGPLLGGYLTDNLGWPWIFYVNIPVGLIVAQITWTLLKDHESPTVREPIDVLGLLLLVVSVICFQLVLDRGHELDWLASLQIRVMLGAAVVCFVLFVAWEIREPYPMVDLSLFRHGSFSVGVTLLSVFYGAFIVSGIIYPLWAQTIMGYPAVEAGIVMSPSSIIPLLGFPLVGKYITRYDLRKVVTIGIVCMIGAFLLHARTTTDTDSTYLAVVRFLTGIGMPMSWMPLMILALTGLPPDKIGTATGMFNFMRMAAASMGTAIAVTAWDERSIFHRARLVEQLSADALPFQDAMATLGHALGESQARLAMIEQLVQQQARTLGMQDVYLMCCGAMVLIGISVWFLPSTIPDRQAGPKVVAAHD